jgi:6-phosphogluconolactonase (cycloisomerase 2 family)
MDATGKPTPGPVVFTDGQDLTVDATNKFLLEVDSAGIVHVFLIDPVTGALSQTGTSEAAGNGAFDISMDPGGRFVIIGQSTNTGLPNPANQITVFTFDPVTGAMKKLNSYPQMPGHAVIASL